MSEARIKRMAKLHEKMEGAIRQSLADATEIGKLLQEEKDEVGHGNWLSWVKEHAPFSRASANNYMRLYENRAEIKLLNVSNVSSAYKQMNRPPLERKRLKKGKGKGKGGKPGKVKSLPLICDSEKDREELLDFMDEFSDVYGTSSMGATTLEAFRELKELRDAKNRSENFETDTTGNRRVARKRSRRKVAA